MVTSVRVKEIWKNYKAQELTLQTFIEDNLAERGVSHGELEELQHKVHKL